MTHLFIFPVNWCFEICCSLICHVQPVSDLRDPSVQTDLAETLDALRQDGEDDEPGQQVAQHDVPLDDPGVLDRFGLGQHLFPTTRIALKAHVTERLADTK